MGFGDFDSICDKVALPICALLGSNDVNGGRGIQPECYARTIQLANTTIFEGAASFVHIAALLMTIIMIIHVRSKFTAVGRKEITTFFYIYMALTAVSLILDAGVIPPGSSVTPYFVSIQIGMAGALCLCLFINGFVGFQIYEDGTTLSVWLLRICSLIWFLVLFLISLLTVQGWAGLGPDKTTALFVFMYIFNAAMLVVYFTMQFLLVVRTLEDRWPLGDLAFAGFFFVLGQVILYSLSHTICQSAQHYVDGLFFATLLNLLAVMMVYKYWDSITREDLEFSVGTKTGNWDVKEFIPVGQDDPYDASVVRDSTLYGFDRMGQTADRTSHPAFRASHYDKSEY